MVVMKMIAMTYDGGGNNNGWRQCKSNGHIDCEGDGNKNGGCDIESDGYCIKMMGMVMLVVVVVMKVVTETTVVVVVVM